MRPTPEAVSSLLSGIGPLVSVIISVSLVGMVAPLLAGVYRVLDIRNHFLKESKRGIDSTSRSGYSVRT